MPRIPRTASDITLDLVSSSLSELAAVRTELQKDADRQGITVYELRNADGSMPALALNVAVSNLILASTTLLSNSQRF